MSGVLTFDEITELIAKDNNISKEEAEKHVISTFYNNKNVSGLSTQSSVSPYAATYRTLTSRFTVTSSYQPALKYYVQTDEGGGSFRAIVKILNVGMDRNWNGMSKQFSGDVYTHLQNPNRIYYIVNGDFYNNGTTVSDGSVNIGIGDFFTVQFGVSYSSNHYKYCYVEGYYNF
jgi:hypothetical protein